MAAEETDIKMYPAQELRSLLPQAGRNPRTSTATWALASARQLIHSERFLLSPDILAPQTGVLTSEREGIPQPVPPHLLQELPQTGAVSAQAAHHASLVFRNPLIGPVWPDL